MTRPRPRTLLVMILLPMVLGGVLAFVLLRRPHEPDRDVPTPPVDVPVLTVLPNFVLTDQAGNEFGSDQLVGHVWIGTFIFTRCQATCPAQTATMVRLQQRLRGSPHRDLVRLVSISVDPDHDTPAVLREYAARHQADTQSWHFLTGPVDDVRDLSESGFRLATGGDAAGEPAHSSKLALVDQLGRVRGYYEGQTPEALDDLWRDLERVAGEAAPPAVYLSESAARLDPGQVFVQSMTGDGWLRARQREQTEEARRWQVFHGFRFTDRRYASGITFRNRVVDDAGRLFKAVHYDHGNGLVVADVDGDGHEDIYFVNQVGPSQLWRNLGGGRFEDVTAAAGVGLPELIKVTATFADVNNDGAPDLYVTTVRGGNRLFLNDGKGRFTDATAVSGLGLSGHYSGAVFFDYDRDGLLDLFLCDVGKYTSDDQRPVSPPPTVPGDPAGSGPEYRYFEGFPDAFSGHLVPGREGKSRLFRNTGNATFADVTEQVGLAPAAWSGDATPFDVNGDGWPDLYVLNMQGNDEYFENQGGKAFVRKSGAVFPKTPWGSMGAKVFDWNNDGVLDLLVTDMHSDMSDNLGTERAPEKQKSEMTWPETYLRTSGASIFGNALYQGDGKGAFRDVSDPAGAETYWPWGPSVGDLNADGFQDVFVTAGMGYPFRYGVNSLLLNDGGRRFVDAEFALGVEPRRGRRTARPWFKLDASGADADHPAAKGRTGPVTFWGALSSRSSAVFDLDNDGDLDVVTNEFNSEPLVLVSDLSKRKEIRYLKVRLVGGATASTKAAAAGPAVPGAQSNRDGLGATVRVRCGDRSYLQVHDGKSGYLSQSCLPLYFGLGDAAAADEIEVRWPSGRRQTIAGPIPANRLMTIEEPTTPAP